jgi:hypothetical protein
MATTAEERKRASDEKRRKAEEARAAAAAAPAVEVVVVEPKQTADVVVVPVPAPTNAPAEGEGEGELKVDEDDQQELDDPDAPITDKNGNILSYSDGKILVTSPAGVLIEGPRAATIEELEIFDPDAIELANRKAGEKAAEEKKEEKKEEPPPPDIDQAHPWTLTIQTPDPKQAVPMAEQRKQIEAMRSQLAAMNLDAAVIETMIEAGLGKVQALTGVEEFMSSTPAAVRLRALYLTIAPALRDIERNAIVLATKFNQDNPGKTPITWNRGQFVTTFEAQGIAAANGEVQQRKRRDTSAPSTSTAASTNVSEAKAAAAAVRPTEWQIFKYQQMGKPEVVPGFKVWHSAMGTTYYAMRRTGEGSLSYHLATWDGHFHIITGPGAKEFTSMNQCASHGQNGNSVNAWIIVQWPDVTKPQGFRDRNDKEYEARALDWATRNGIAR